MYNSVLKWHFPVDVNKNVTIIIIVTLNATTIHSPAFCLTDLIYNRPNFSTVVMIMPGPPLVSRREYLETAGMRYFTGRPL